MTVTGNPITIVPETLPLAEIVEIVVVAGYAPYVVEVTVPTGGTDEDEDVDAWDVDVVVPYPASQATFRTATAP